MLRVKTQVYEYFALLEREKKCKHKIYSLLINVIEEEASHLTRTINERVRPWNVDINCVHKLGDIRNLRDSVHMSEFADDGSLRSNFASLINVFNLMIISCRSKAPNFSRPN